MFERVNLTGARAGQVVPVTKTLLAGRSPDCSLEIPDPNSSRQHSRFLYDGTSVTVQDNGSSNGTYVNDVRLTAPHRLHHDDVVRIGETRMRFQVREHGDGSTNPSSIFGFKEAEGDISQSILISVAELQGRSSTQTLEVMATRLNAVIKISKVLVKIDDLQQVFESILDTMFEVFPQADRGFLMLGDQIGTLQPKAVRQRGKAVTENLSVSTSICRQALEQRGAILFDDTKNNANFDQGKSIVNLRIRSAMVVPLMIGEAILGLLQIDTPDRTRTFTRDDLDLAAAVSQQAAFVLHNAQLLIKVEQEATTRKNLMRFLPGPLVEQVLSGHVDLALGGRTCQGTILFSDIVGFTTLSEDLHPEQVVKLMNRYFNRMVPCIEQTTGSVDKFMGDAIMAVWGIPFDELGDSASRAALAALSMQNAMIGFNAMQAAEGGVPLDIGIGLNTGTVVAGNVGTESRQEYTVLGDTVNTAQRLESVAGRGQILISARTWNELKGASFGLRMPPLKVKNKTEPVATYSLRGFKQGAEIMLHLPARSGDRRVWIIRRLADRTFLILHPPDLDLARMPLMSASAEWPGIEFGVPGLEAVHANQPSDGTFLRSQVRLADASLQGLLHVDPLSSQLAWEAMGRGNAAYA